MLDFLKGRKTYITAIVYAIAAVLDQTGTYTVPDLVFQVLAALGLITLRMGVANK